MSVVTWLSLMNHSDLSSSYSLLNPLWCIFKSSQTEGSLPSRPATTVSHPARQRVVQMGWPSDTLSCPASSPVSPPPATWQASGAALFVCSTTAFCLCHWVSGLICVTRTAVWVMRRLCSCVTSTKIYFCLSPQAYEALVCPVVHFWGCWNIQMSFISSVPLPFIWVMSVSLHHRSRDSWMAKLGFQLFDK